MYKFLTATLLKMSQNIFAYFSISEHSAFFSSLFQEKTFFGYGQGFPPPLRLRTGPLLIGFLLRLVLSKNIMQLLRRSEGWTDRQKDGWTDGRMDGWTDGQMDRWTEGRMDIFLLSWHD